MTIIGLTNPFLAALVVGGKPKCFEVRVMTYDMEELLEGCCFRHLELIKNYKTDTTCLEAKDLIPFVADGIDNAPNGGPEKTEEENEPKG